MFTIHVCFGLQIYEPLNIRVVGLRAETWTNGDQYGGFVSLFSTLTLFRFEEYVRTSVQESYDAVFLIT